MRCASPPDSSGAGCPSRRYPSPDAAEGVERAGGGGQVVERCGGLVDRHAEDVGDRRTVPVDLERLGVVPGAVALGARRPAARQEQQLDRDGPLALADLAPATSTLNEKRPADQPRSGRRPWRRRPGGRRRTAPCTSRGSSGRAADRLLVDLDHAADDRVRRRDGGQDTADERGLARTGHAGDRGHHTPRGRSTSRWSRLCSETSGSRGCRRACAARAPGPPGPAAGSAG